MGSLTRVEFLRDFRGRATAENYYVQGEVVDLPSWQAAACLAEGVVVKVGQVAPPDDTGAAAPSPAAPVVTKPKRVYRKKAAAE